MRPNWVPEKLPRNWPFTAVARGWVRWYKGKSRYVCGKDTPLAEVEDRWIAVKQAIDRAAPRAARLAPLALFAVAYLAVLAVLFAPEGYFLAAAGGDPLPVAEQD